MIFKQEKERIGKKIEALKDEGKSLFLSSSFQTHSIPLLHLISTIDNKIPVYFLNTGFHFPETIAFKNRIAGLLGINIIDLRSDIDKLAQLNTDGRFFYASDTAYCCHINKVLPMEKVLINHDVWVAGVRKDQNATRNTFQEIEDGAHDTLRYHPILDWTTKDIHNYRNEFDLPANPLEEMGYLSIGCEPCTSKYLDEMSRGGRWSGTQKDECGLHTDLIKK